MKEVVHWSPTKVAAWVTETGMQEYSETFHNLNGQKLLKLTEKDFGEPLLSQVTSDNRQQLLERIEILKIKHHIEEHKNGHDNGHLGISTDVLNFNNHFSSKNKKNGMPNGFRKEMIQIPMPEPERLNPFPSKWRKTFMAFFYGLCCFIFATVMISVVQERVPPKEEQPPLPDAIFYLFDRRQWAFSICEINGMILMALCLVQWLFIKYKSIVSRRFFCIVGYLYLYRCITMYVTTLPVPVMHFRCSPRLFGDWEAQLRRIMKMIARGGLSITGSHTMCGDYLYSGHTVMLTLTYMRFRIYHWICWILSIVRILCILLSHDHYTVDVVVAYYITSRLFWWFHTMANQQVLKGASTTNLLSHVWWYKPSQYFENNIQGTVPCKSLGLGHWPRSCQLPFRRKFGRPVEYSRLVSET